MICYLNLDVFFYDLFIFVQQNFLMRFNGLGAIFIIIILLLLGAITGYWLQIGLLIFVFINVLVAGAVFIRMNLYVKSFHHGNRKVAKIALTFDDGPHLQTPAVLAVLEKYNAKGTFFCIGENIEKKTQIAKQIVEQGHVISNHTFSHHRWFDLYPSARMQTDIEACNAVIKKITGVENLYFRPPYGVTNPPLAKAIQKSGLQSIGWSFRTYDTNKTSALELKNAILRKIKNGDIVLLHDRTPDLPQLLNEILPLLQQKGFTFVTIKELLDS